MPTIRVLAADAQPLFLDGLARAIRQRAPFQLVAEAVDGRTALEAILALRPDVAVVATALPGLDGRRIARVVRREEARTRVVLLATPGARELAYHALEDGAAAVLTRAVPPGQLCEAIAAAARGGTYLAPDVQGDVAWEIRTRAAVPPRLTGRERDVLARIAAGQSVPAIAQELHLAPGTVKTHVTHVYERLGVRERAAAVAEAMRRGLLE